MCPQDHHSLWNKNEYLYILFHFCSLSFYINSLGKRLRLSRFGQGNYILYKTQPYYSWSHNGPDVRNFDSNSLISILILDFSFIGFQSKELIFIFLLLHLLHNLLRSQWDLWANFLHNQELLFLLHKFCYFHLFQCVLQCIIKLNCVFLSLCVHLCVLQK